MQKKNNGISQFKILRYFSMNHLTAPVVSNFLTPAVFLWAHISAFMAQQPRHDVKTAKQWQKNAAIPCQKNQY